MRLLIGFCFILSAWKWSDWRNWKKYYPSILYIMLVNCFAEIITINRELWHFNPSSILTNDAVSEIFITLTVFPSTVLLFLSNYPEKEGLGKQSIFIGGWIILYGAIELVTRHLNLISYMNGWGYGWSVIHNFVMFPLIRIHQTNPLLAWGLAGIFTLFIWCFFGFSIADLNN